MCLLLLVPIHLYIIYLYDIITYYLEQYVVVVVADVQTRTRTSGASKGRRNAYYDYL